MQGVIAAVPTPVNRAGEPEKERFLDHCRWVLANGCDGLNVLGSTGEANSFGTETRKQVMAWAARSLDTKCLMVGTGTPVLSETVTLTQAADELGYGVALVLPPYYYKPVSETGLFAWYAALHKALGDRAISIYLYNFPQMTGLTIPVSVITKLCRAYPERFLGIKDSSGDLAYCRQIVDLLPGFSVFPSSEVTLSEAVQCGFAGCISATVNQTAPLCAELWSTRHQPDAVLIEKISALRRKISVQPLVPSVKYLVSQRTGEIDWERLLPPFCQLSEMEKRQLAPVVDELQTMSSDGARPR